jgi:hypothetical protein
MDGGTGSRGLNHKESVNLQRYLINLSNPLLIPYLFNPYLLINLSFSTSIYGYHQF